MNLPLPPFSLRTLCVISIGLLTLAFAPEVRSVAASSPPPLFATTSGNAKTVDEIPFVNGSIDIPSTPNGTNNRGVIMNTTLPGMTHIEAYLTWSQLEPAKDQWNMQEFDEMLGLSRQRHLKMLILPCLVPPDWFKQTDGYTPLINIRTGESSASLPGWMPQMSPWAPATLAGHDHFYAYVADHYRDKIDVVKFYIEVGLRVKGNDFWCGDRYARTDFEERMQAKYGSLAKLNAAWGTSFATPSDIAYPDPSQRSAQQRRWVDFVTWYQDSQVRAMVQEIKIIRKHFPSALIDLPMGNGNDIQSDGCDRTAIIRAAAPFTPINIRSTHGSDNRNRYPQAYWFYKRMAPLCHDLNIGFGTEPPGGDLKYNEIRRQEFEDASAGANFIFQYFQNFHLKSDPKAEPHIIDDYKSILRPYEQTLVDIGVLYPTTQMMLDLIGFPRGQEAFCALGREHFDYDLVDENMIDWGLLSHYKILLQTSGTVFRPETLPAIGSWLKAGGILVTNGPPQWSDIDGKTVVVQSWLTKERPGDPQMAPGARVFNVGKGGIYAVDASTINDYLTKVVALLTSIAAGRPAGSPIHGFKAASDGTYITDFPDGHLVFNTSTLDTSFVSAMKEH